MRTGLKRTLKKGTAAAFNGDIVAMDMVNFTKCDLVRLTCLIAKMKCVVIPALMANMLKTMILGMPFCVIKMVITKSHPVYV